MLKADQLCVQILTEENRIYNPLLQLGAKKWHIYT